MIIDIGTGVDESVVKWKYNDKDKWRDADIDELIHLYESVVHCKDCRYWDREDKYCTDGGGLCGGITEDDYCSMAVRREK